MDAPEGEGFGRIREWTAEEEDSPEARDAVAMKMPGEVQTKPKAKGQRRKKLDISNPLVPVQQKGHLEHDASTLKADTSKTSQTNSKNGNFEDMVLRHVKDLIHELARKEKEGRQHARRAAEGAYTVEQIVNHTSLGFQMPVMTSVVDYQTKMESITSKMIAPDPWVCDLIPGSDQRRKTCNLEPGSKELRPKTLDCGERDTCAVEHANAFRIMYPVGSLPCCSTYPFCAAPVCNKNNGEPTSLLLDERRDAENSLLLTSANEGRIAENWANMLLGEMQKTRANHHRHKDDKPVCTVRAPEDNAAYMKLPQLWPAYHGFGGAFELDILKFFDVLANEKLTPFDLAFDLGANYGYYTELLTVRDFAKNYVLVEANPEVVSVLRKRWGNKTFLDAWYTTQTASALELLNSGPTHVDKKRPAFELVNQALSNDTGTLDMCKTEPALESSGCKVAVNTFDNMVPGNLTGKFRKHFQAAQSAFIKVDTEGMDELVLRGMENMLNEQRGEYEDGSPRYLVNFLQFEYCPQLMKDARHRGSFNAYSIKTATQFMESMGFETFLVGPRYLPMSGRSWHEDYKLWPEDAFNNAGHRSHYPDFEGTLFHSCYSSNCSGDVEVPSFTSDVFAIRASHPLAARLKLMLGACKESHDFQISDVQ